jgi:4-amino-4-deoxy-L-arabinose transferase-like glycosyltransferase
MTSVITQFRTQISKVSAKKLFRVLALISALLFFVGLNARYLMDSDEPRVAGLSTEMNLSGNYLEPHLNGKSFLEKPPLYFWVDAVTLKVADKFGVRGPMAAKLPSAVASFLGVLVLFGLLRAMRYSPLSCMLGGLFLATSAQYWRNGRKCIVDTFLCFFILLTLAAFYKLASTEKGKHRICFFVLYVLALGGAVMSKGLVGAAIPGLAIGAFLVLDDLLIEKRFTWKRWLIAAAGGFLGMIPILIWFGMLYKYCGFDEFYTASYTNNIGRFTGGHAEHVEPFYYYLTKLPELFQPWSALLLLAFYWVWTRLRNKAEDSRALLFMLAWLLPTFLLMMISSGKRIVYLLPLFPAAALLSGVFSAALLEGKIKLKKFNLDIVLNYIFYILPAIPAVGGIVFGCLMINYGKSGMPVFMTMISGLVPAFFAYYFMRDGRFMMRYALCLIFGLVLTFLQIDVEIFGPISAKRSFNKYFAAVEKQIDDNTTIYLFKPSERFCGASVYYLQRTNFPVVKDLNAVKPQDQRSKIIILSARKRLPKGTLESGKYDVCVSIRLKKDEFLVLTPKK